MAALVARALRTQDHDVTVASAYPGNLRDGLGDGRILSLPVDPGRKWTAPVAVAKLRRVHPDAIYTMHRWPAFLARFGRRRSSPPVTYHVQSLVEPRRFTWWGDRTIAVSHAIRRHAIAHGADPSRTVVVPNGPVYSPPDPAEVDRVLEEIRRQMPGRTVAVFAGRIVEGKGLDVLLDALAAVRGLGLVVLGDGELRDPLRSSLAGRGIADRVWFAGWVDDVSPWAHAADIGVVPSDTYPEGLPLSALELMAAGLPVVVTDRSGLPEAVDHGVDGLVVRRGDAQALAAALTRLVDDPSFCAELGDRARRKIAADFDPERLSREIAGIVVSGAPAPTPAG